MRNFSIIFVSLFFFNISYAQTNDEIVKRFTETLESVKTKLTAKDAENSPPAGNTKEWYRRKASILMVDMDILKTNSLINPIVGEVSFICNLTGTKALTLEDLNKKADDFSLPTMCKSSFSFRSSQWRLTKLQCEKSDLETRRTSYVTISETTDGFALKQCYSAFKDQFNF